MWRRTYLLLLAVRCYFAISPSYIHPDENFQGPEVIAGMLLRCVFCRQRSLKKPPSPHLRTGEIDLGIIIMHKPHPRGRAGRLATCPPSQQS